MNESQPTPESRVKEGVSGIPVVFGDGQTWVIPRFGLARAMAWLRDEVYETSIARQSVTFANVKAGAYYGLAINYDLSDAEIQTLIEATDPQTITEAICEALLPIEMGRRTFSAWARSALLANGLAPSEIPAEDLPHVLEQLVQTGRAMSHIDYTDVGQGLKVRRNLLSQLGTE